ncbi:MAG: TIGR04282 family arsenosugar biosynthesis glycosyltransferase [Pseudomonadota bacterium]|nr:TIGR04282 family arsenosugar biosynthesis glycosyltransferase [Pseudomonadota bacterium]
MGADPQQLASRYGYPRRPATVSAAVSILAKAPVAGLAKTRLIPALGAAGAARAQRRFTIAAVHGARQSGLGPVTLWCAPDRSHRLFRALDAATGVAVLSQATGDLGDRMHRAAAHHFATPSAMPLLLVGTDCAVLAPGHLQQAARALADHDVVLIPAEDGGYVLIGMRRPVSEAFAGVAWSTSAVLVQTRDRLRDAGASWLELKPLWDVDEPHDWSRLQHLLDPLEPTR